MGSPVSGGGRVVLLDENNAISAQLSSSWAGAELGNTLKIDYSLKSVLFCKYLCNESFDLYEILNLSSYVSNDLPETFL